ncbi:class I SAM-dependent DNA methyltransferase [Hyalangium sp.]|uniref:type I restriction-modification system subunit M n=1 Tax=Hyalangium sp. TaxID=2028555 RepID=UPI002D496004|nr:class I SAM-dependent DNA methyltransferase [Hyalangium sp.]HYH98211.1 class I SAM-dependent DNA methyltransferase [Hyalangium sp.]
MGLKKGQTPSASKGTGVMDLVKELWQAAVTLRGSIEPAEYKRFVLPLIFLRFLSLRIEHHRPGALPVPRKARWSELLAHAGDDDIKARLDDALEALEKAYPDRLRGLLPRLYAASNMDRHNVTRLLHLFSRDVFTQEHGGEDLLGRVYEYFIGEFASSEGKRGGEYFTPASIVRLLVAMLEPRRGVVYDPCCGSGGMFVQTDLFAKHSRQLSFFGQESKEFTYRLCRMNLFIHGLEGDIRLGNTYSDDRHPKLKADYILSNPPFNDGSKGREGWGANQLSEDEPRRVIAGKKMPLSPRNANPMWMMHFLYHLKDGGTAGFVMAAGELSNNQTGRLEVRTALVEADFVDCVVQLSTQLFANTQIPCTLWFLSKSRTGGKASRRRLGEILFIDGRSLGALIPGSRRQKQLSDEEVERIASVYREFRLTARPQEVPGFARVASLQEVRDQGYALTPGRYVEAADVEEAEDFEERLPRLTAQLEQQLARAQELDERLRTLVKELSRGQ